MSQYAPPARITFLCHPATPQQKAGIFPADEPLDPESLVQLATIPWNAPQSARILTAPEKRTCQTAAALKLAATEAPELRECDFGKWRGVALETLQSGDPASLSEWLRDITASPHGGESFYNLVARVGTWLGTQLDGGHVIAVTHASIIRAAIVNVLHASPQEAFQYIEIAPMTITDIRSSRGYWRVRSVGVPIIGTSID